MEILDFLSPTGGIHKWLSPLYCSAVLWSEMRSMTFCHLERSNRNHILKKFFFFFFKEPTHLPPTPSTGKQPRPGQRADSGIHVHHATSWENHRGLPHSWRRRWGLAKQSPVADEPWVLEDRALPLPGGEGGS